MQNPSTVGKQPAPENHAELAGVDPSIHKPENCVHSVHCSIEHRSKEWSHVSKLLQDMYLYIEQDLCSSNELRLARSIYWEYG